MTTRLSATLVLVALAALTGCEAPDRESPIAPEVRLAHVAGLSQASGGGHYLITLPGLELPGTFSFTANQKPNGTTGGQIRYTVDFGGVEAIFRGEVTCLTVDLEEGRAWIGGVVTRNDSEVEPYASGEQYQEGHDIWFRVLDDGEGAGVIDRTTFVGFEGDAGIDTSEEYCELAIWPDDNERAWPVQSGNIQVH